MKTGATVAVALLSLAACCCGAEPVYVSRHGMAVFLESDRLPTKRDFEPLETALRIALDQLDNHAPRTRLEGLLSKSELHLYSRKVECGGEYKWGCYEEGGRIDAVGWTDCPAEWILHHELVHMAQEADGREQSHRWPWFGDGSIESALLDAMKAGVRACDKVPIY